MERRVTLAAYFVIGVFALLVLRLFDLQVIHSSDYKKIDERNRLRVLNIPAQRGIIYDRKDRPLVNNVPSFDITVVKEDISEKHDKLLELARLIDIPGDEIKKKLAAGSSSFKPVTLKRDISFEEVARIEARKIDFPGLQIDTVEGREYLYGNSASHVLGYLGQLSPQQMSTAEYSGLHQDTAIGKYGGEKAYDDALRGIAGKRMIAVDATGSIVKVARIQKPVRGKNIKLTIDIDLQLAAEKGLEGHSGAVVAIQPQTGEVLALASSPSFDPNYFVRGIDQLEWKKLLTDPRKPLLNRAIQSQYPPGSTFKIITALTALEEGIINRDTLFYCSGSIFLGRTFGCWKKEGHGAVDLHKALVESCDVYFYEVAKKMNVDKLAHFAMAFGLGRQTGIDLEGEVEGIVPSTSWKRKTKKANWYKGDTLNTAIGQGYLSATPLQMAQLIAAVANGGKRYTPYLLKDARGSEKLEDTVKIKPWNFSLVKKALIGVVTGPHGTGYMARSDIVSIGGKTGTSQVVREIKDNDAEVSYKQRDHAWFVAFAPDENPQIAVAVLVEHGGHGSTAAAPIAKAVIETYFKQLENPGNI